MRKYSILTLLLLMVMFAQGCSSKPVHIIGVSPEMQETERFIRTSQITLDKADSARDIAFETVIGLYKAGEVSEDDFATAIKASKSFDLAFDKAGEALMDYRLAINRGENPDKSLVETALGKLDEVLLELQGEI